LRLLSRAYVLYSVGAKAGEEFELQRYSGEKPSSFEEMRRFRPQRHRELLSRLDFARRDVRRRSAGLSSCSAARLTYSRAREPGATRAALRVAFSLRSVLMGRAMVRSEVVNNLQDGFPKPSMGRLVVQPTRPDHRRFDRFGRPRQSAMYEFS
jgi:hypothetical protein